ncbi:MAG: hypothetical protein DI537_14550 [Stutzerimonas stutzeri]|nr:MAG: hypothetical protein DI537_14550 [Stutzerimonas stutzeri]
MKKITFLALAGSLLLAGCGVDPNQAHRALSAQGLRDVRLGGYSLFGCDKHDTFRSNFSATGANGQRITGVVCSGWLKGATVRYD